MRNMDTVWELVYGSTDSGYRLGACLSVTRRKLRTPGTAKEHRKQVTPTINPGDRQAAQLTAQTPITNYRAAQESHNTWGEGKGIGGG